MADLNTHAEALKSIFKKIISGQYTYEDGSKSVDIIKGKEDWNPYDSVDLSLSEYDLDRFANYIYDYVLNQKLNENDIEALIEEFNKTDLKIDEFIGWEIHKLWEGEMFHFQN